MTLDQLRYFIAAAKYEHVSRAAKSFPISPSVISSAIKSLEEEYDCELFTREKQRIRLTERGRQLMAAAVDLLNQAEGIRSKVFEEVDSISGHYDFAAGHFLSLEVLSPALSNLQNEHPGLLADVHTLPSWRLIDDILLGKIDLGLGFSPIPHPNLETEKIYEGSSKVVVRRDHPILKKKEKERHKFLKDYAATMHMANQRVIPARQHPMIKAINSDFQISLGFDSDYVALYNLRNSNNWCFMVDIVYQRFSKYLEVISLPSKLDAKYSIHIMWHKSRTLDAGLEATLKHIRKCANNIGKIKGEQNVFP